MKPDPSDYQLDIETRVRQFQADRRRCAEIRGLEFETLEDESKPDVAAPALPKPSSKPQ